jgi:uncharacterized protein YcfJ
VDRIRRSVIVLSVLVLFASWLASSTPPVEVAAQTTKAPVPERRSPPALIFDENGEKVAVVGVIGAVAGGVVGAAIGWLEGAVVGAAVGGVVSAGVANLIHHWQQGNVPAVQSSLPRTALD